MKVLITGVSGFCASWLAEAYIERGDEVQGTIRQRSDLGNIECIRDKLGLHYCDMRDGHSVLNVIDKVRPDVVEHAAAVTFVPFSWQNPSDTLETNIMGTLNVLEAMRRVVPDAGFHYFGSSEEYGLVHPEELPIKETNPLRPLSPYAVSKVSGELLAKQYHYSYGIRAVLTRAFNHFGPRQSPHLVTSNFTLQIAQAEKQGSGVIKVGNLDAVRDFTDVRDVARAYMLALEHCEPGEPYNVCSGRAWSIRQVLDMILELTDAEIKIEPDPERMRPSDAPIYQGDCSKFHKLTGWRPAIEFKESLAESLNYWRRRL